ncbi:hypothetical protein ASE66_14585 [Bosea sp. Root483D1]|uniref:helix-turn-helix transcriptional regulator n=1 Tax=Bosea sp. Root483D1 TaxID=1736544 RepID=UPI00070C1AC6|nr:hypothetical protein [Bosea sp. Root483D1]KRE14581.1 hypothetical protein ASE66_14585 [Bosea sp. Root483D1]
MDDETLQRAETMFLDAATDPEAWQAALEMVARATRSKGAAILTVEGRGPFVLPTSEMGELAERYVKDGWHQRDFRYAGIPLMKRSGIMVDQDIVAPDRMARMDYYADFLRPMGFGWFAGLRVTTGDDLWCLTFQRGEDVGAYLPEDQVRLARLGDVVSRAATIARRLEFIRLDGAVDAADATAGACLFIDRFCRIVRMTAAAEAMVGRQFHIRQGRIAFSHCASDALDRHLAASIWPDLAPDAAALRPVTVSRPGQRPLVFHAIRLRGNALGFFAPAFAMVTVKDLEEAPRHDIETFGRHYRLTPSELRVAQAIIERHGVIEAATSLGISHETARSHAKALYAKTSTANQVELVSLILRFR